MEIIAHRGAAFEAPENSLEAFDLAIKAGAHRLELDIQLSSDLVPIVIHDETTARTADTDVEVQYTTSAELREIRLENGEPIPTFEQVCELAAGRTTLDVELKATSREVAAGILDIMRRHHVLDDALITSFDPQVLRLIRLLGFEGRTGLIVGSMSKNLRQRAYEAWPVKAIATAGATELVIHHRLLHSPLHNWLRKNGYGVVVWMSLQDESKPTEKRAAYYQRIERMKLDGAIVARIREAAPHLGFDPRLTQAV